MQTLPGFYESDRNPNPAYYHDDAIWCPNCGALYPGYTTPDWHSNNGSIVHVCADGIPRETRGPLGTQF